MLINNILKIAPYDPGLNRDLLVHRIQAQNLVELSHVDVQTVFVSGLTSHAETSSANGDGASGRPDCFHNLINASWLDLFIYLNRIYRGDIVHSLVRYHFVIC